MPSKEDITDITCKLRNEFLLLEAERESLKSLNIEVEQQRSRLYQLAWICRQQHLNLAALIYSNPDATPPIVCQRAHALEQIKFIEGYKRLESSEPLVADALRLLTCQPAWLAELLHYGENFEGTLLHDMVQLTYSSIFGSCTLSNDERCVLEILQQLVTLQLVPASNPRQLIRKGSCAFGRLYKLFSEGLYSAKLFLTASLHEPIMNVLAQDELFLDIDPSKAAVRFPPNERQRRFGTEGTVEYKENLEKYRRVIVQKLTALTQRFIDGIRSQMHCFPKCLSWLVRQLYEQLVAGNPSVSKEEIVKLCTDLVFTCFICPAITNPEPLGIIADVPISYIARFNLMQVGQILQVLAVAQYETVDGKMRDLFGQFDSDAVSHVVRSLLEGQLTTLADLYPTNALNPLMTRPFVLIRQADLNKLLAFLRTVDALKFLDSGSDATLSARQQMSDVLKRLPESFALPDESPSPRSASPLHSPQQNTSKRTSSSLPKIPYRKLLTPEGILQDMTSAFAPHEESATKKLQGTTLKPEVLVITLRSLDEPLGFMAEEKVLTLARQDKRALHGDTDMPDGNGADTAATQESHEKRTRFSLSHDLESVGTSETGGNEVDLCSNQSVCSSMEEMEEANPEMASIIADNLSDMVSANVSGRGTPSISGRDTPLSQHQEPHHDSAMVEDAYDAQEAPDADVASSPSGIPQQERDLPALPITAKKESRADIEEKFGKFEIPPPPRERHRDETHSFVSDTWSTDVLASESEYGGVTEGAAGAALPDLVPGQPLDFPRLDLIAEESHAGGGAAASAGGSTTAGDDRSDTWSVDVLASDSEMEPKGEEDRMHALEPLTMDDFAARDQAFDISSNQGEDGSIVASDYPSESGSAAQFMDFAGPSAASTAQETVGGLPEIAFPASVSSMPPSDQVVPPASQAKGDLRRQSSGSSFYSRSDVESEFSRDNPDENLFIDAGFEKVAPLTMANKTPTTGSDMPLTWPQPVERPNDQLLIDNDDHLMARQTLGRLSFILGSDDASKANGPHGIQGATGSGEGISSGSKPLPPDFLKGSPSKGKERVSQTSSGHSGTGDAHDLMSEEHKRRLKSHHGRRHSGQLDEVDKRKQPFFKALKLPSLTKPKVRRSHTDQQISDLLPHGLTNVTPKVAPSASVDELCKSLNKAALAESSDDILAKYRSPAKPTQTASLTGSNIGAAEALLDLPASRSSVAQAATPASRPYYDAANPTTCQAFGDTKRKLRLVLSSVDMHSFVGAFADFTTSKELSTAKTTSKENELVQFLNVLLAEALNAEDKTLTAQLRETIRCLVMFDARGIRKLVRALRDEHRKRAAYVSYLHQSKMMLLQSKALFDKLINRVQREQALCSECLVDVCVRLYLEQRERQLQRFVLDFQRLEVQDEKTDGVERFLTTLCLSMEADPVWKNASEEQIARAQLCIERSIMSQIYIAALYPNGDGDVSRDQVLHDHIKRLAQVITPSHKDLRIPAEYHAESPWPAAQAEIVLINAYKTPRDKVQCVSRACETIIYLLKLATRGVPAADDLFPVLVFVLIKANPPGLLSTVQYVHGFYENRLEGQDKYWWTQFCSAVEFIKTMD